MQRKRYIAVAGLAGVALTMSACGSSTSGTTGTAGGASSTSSSAAKVGKVGVILPDTKSSARWETADRPNLQKAFDAAGVPVVIDNANGGTCTITDYKPMGIIWTGAGVTTRAPVIAPIVH